MPSSKNPRYLPIPYLPCKRVKKGSKIWLILSGAPIGEGGRDKPELGSWHGVGDDSPSSRNERNSRASVAVPLRHPPAHRDHQGLPGLAGASKGTNEGSD